MRTRRRLDLPRRSALDGKIWEDSGDGILYNIIDIIYEHFNTLFQFVAIDLGKIDHDLTVLPNPGNHS